MRHAQASRLLPLICLLLSPVRPGRWRRSAAFSPWDTYMAVSCEGENAEEALEAGGGARARTGGAVVGDG